MNVDRVTVESKRQTVAVVMLEKTIRSVTSRTIPIGAAADSLIMKRFTFKSLDSGFVESTKGSPLCAPLIQ